MSDKTSHIYEGLGTALEIAYTASVTSATTSGVNCEVYDHIILYFNVSAVSGAGNVDVFVEFSDDGTNFYIPQVTIDGSSTKVYKYYAVSATGAYHWVCPGAGKFFRVRVAYVSGTSLTINRFHIEAKS